MDFLINEVTALVAQVKNGFKPMKQVADDIFNTHTNKESKLIAEKLYSKKEYQVRMIAVFLFGYLSSSHQDVLSFLKSKVSTDENWRVQEILAMSFDRYCKDISYKKAIPTIEDWLDSESANVRRAVTEGLRIWTSRPYFKDNPQVAIRYLTKLKEDDSEYVRKSVGNALRDISKKHKQLVIEEVLGWNLSNEYIKQTYSLIVKNGLLL